MTPASRDDLMRLMGLDALVSKTSGSPAVTVGIIDGTVLVDHPSLAGVRVAPASPSLDITCRASGPACDHGTFITGILASRSPSAKGICPGCSFVVRPVFVDEGAGRGPSTSAEELASAVAECVRAGARILNLSLAMRRASERGYRELGAAIDEAARRGVVIVAAAGNEGAIASSAITRHPWVLPVVAYDRRGALLGYSNLSRSIGRGVGGPGDWMIGASAEGERPMMGGTSAATAFVTGAAALLWSVAPNASAGQLRAALCPPSTHLVPPLMDARAALARLGRSVVLDKR